MFLAHFMIGADNRAFQQTPHILDPIGMNITGLDPFFLTVVHALMFGVMVAYAQIRFIFIGNDNFGIRCRVVFNELMEGLSVGVLNSFQSDLAVTLNNAHG